MPGTTGMAGMAGTAGVGAPRRLFLLLLAASCLFAFAALYAQIPGLYGDEGIAPVSRLLADSDRPVLEQLQANPTLLLLGPHLGLAPQQVMELLCLLGALLAFGAVVWERLRSGLVFLILWVLNLSLHQAGQGFLHCKWDHLLLEAGFLAVPVAPFLCGGSASQHHDRVTFWLTRWLLFRATFGGGVAKLALGDSDWWNLSALSRYFEGQPSPTPLSWYCHHLPDWLLKLGVVVQLEAEIVVPFLFFAPIRCLRLSAFYVQVLLQICSFLTGNHGLLNLLTAALCLSLLDSDHVGFWLGHKKKRRSRTWTQAAASLLPLLFAAAVWAVVVLSAVQLFRLRVDWDGKTVSSKTIFTQQEFQGVLKAVAAPSIWLAVLSLTWEVVSALLGSVCVRGTFAKLSSLVQSLIFSSVAVALFALSVRKLNFPDPILISSSMVPYMAVDSSSSRKIFPEVQKAYSAVQNYRLVNSYGLESNAFWDDGRPEIIIEGSVDNTTWTEIDFLYKIGNENVAPPFMGPYLPRLDWWMWQAAHAPRDRSPWFTVLVLRLLQGRRDVVHLLQVDEGRYPFHQSPPRFIRAKLYRYRFTQRRADGTESPQWWTRRYVDDFYPTVHFTSPDLQRMLTQQGLTAELLTPPTPDSPISQALALARNHISALSGPLLLLALAATAASIHLIGAAFGHRARSAPTDPRGRKTKDGQQTSDRQRSRKENQEERMQESERSPRKRRK
ncbi:lipase maturation factor 2-like isoform X1 [Denticeps clupeoides]|uniref:lipase maturation factor 2-like isoform X1 n=1 Tax=Denticeps clupeoides TaxID=299321 RepID=UPI0010A338B9|nr:lipase maturation factor 2-like isoform X1 [Denticeps clupeoides]